MRPVARIGDVAQGTCSCHKSPRSVTGVIVGGSGVSSSNGPGIARLGDVVVFNCGHTGTIASGSDVLFVDNVGAARIGDVVVGCVRGTIVSGDGSVFSS